MTVTSADLAKIPLFDGIELAQLDEIACWFELKTTGAGVRLMGEGDSGYSFFVLGDGEVVVTSDGVELARLAAGDFFGEGAILGQGRRNATVTTATPARLYVLFGTEFRRLQASQPGIAARIEASLRERLARR
jgi:CRP-like cAMP-binding protein